MDPHACCQTFRDVGIVNDGSGQEISPENDAVDSRTEQKYVPESNGFCGEHGPKIPALFLKKHEIDRRNCRKQKSFNENFKKIGRMQNSVQQTDKQRE